MQIYNFKEEDVWRLLREKFPNTKTKTKNSEIALEVCPYCHSKKDTYKFSINRNTGQFECKRASCGIKGNMITLSKDFDFSLGREVDAYCRTVDYSSREFKKFKDAHRAIEVRDGAVEYFQKRGIPEEIVKRYEVTTKAGDSNILVFPFKDADGNLTFVKYRKANFQKGIDKSKEWTEPGCKPILFGMAQCDPEAQGGLIVITEGQIDSMSVATAGYTNAVSVPTGARGFTWVPHCWDFMGQFKTIVVMGDCERGTITLSEEIAKRWKAKVRVCRIEDYRGCKDANELLQKFGAAAVDQAIKNAEPVLNKSIKPLASVKHVDIMQMEMFKTGFNDLDKLLDGGVRFGQLGVLTGKRGEGKSTIASMIGVRVIQQGFNCFFYSGELMDWYFRNWMDCQVTGKGENITPSEYDKLSAWYGKKAYIYDNTVIDGDEMLGLLEAIEVAILQQGCRFILVDNLMTALSDDLSLDIYRAQSKFVGQLASLAKKYNVFILLIAHPRKNNGADMTNDDIAGASGITDKADLTFSFGKPKDEDNPNHEPTMRVLRVLKNRLTGRLTGSSGITLFYDATGSRRLRGQHDDDFRAMDFGWNKDADGFYDLEDFEQADLPF